jgi:hypothetical protein
MFAVAGLSYIPKLWTELFQEKMREKSYIRDFSFLYGNVDK